MAGGQTVAQAHRQIERLIVVHRFEGSTHAHQYTISDSLFLSDKLLGDNYHPRTIQHWVQSRNTVIEVGAGMERT